MNLSFDTALQAILTLVQDTSIPAPAQHAAARAALTLQSASPELQRLLARHPGAVVIAQDQDLQRAIDPLLAKFPEVSYGRPAPARSPRGFSYALTNVWGTDGGHRDLRPNKVIIPAGGKPPHVHASNEKSYQEVARAGSWVVYELRS